MNLCTSDVGGAGGGGCHLRVVPPLGNFIEGQAHPNVFAFLQFSSNRGLSIFCVVKFLSHVFFCVCLVYTQPEKFFPFKDCWLGAILIGTNKLVKNVFFLRGWGCYSNG